MIQERTPVSRNTISVQREELTRRIFGNLKMFAQVQTKTVPRAIFHFVPIAHAWSNPLIKLDAPGLEFVLGHDCCPFPVFGWREPCFSPASPLGAAADEAARKKAPDTPGPERGEHRQCRIWPRRCTSAPFRQSRSI